MEIFGAEGKHVKIGKTSITVRDDNGKTCGIIRNAWKFCELQPNKQVDFSKSVRASGLWGCSIDGIMNRVVICEGKIYYFNDLRVLEQYEQMMKSSFGGFLDTVTKNYIRRKNIVEGCKENAITVINCYID